jgi:virginiamycin A acetyltransferase
MKSKKIKTEGKSFLIIGEILFWLYQFERGTMRSIIRWIILKLEGGTLFSLTIRRIFLKYHKVDIGMYSSYGCFKVNNFQPGVVIGRYCVIYNTAQAFTANHPMNTLSTHSFFYNPTHGYAKEFLLTRTNLIIGNDVYIGHNAIILPSVSSIGDGAIIGAGSVVHIDIPPYAVVVGNPCRIVRYRFSNDKIAELSELKWWENSIDDLLPIFDKFQCPINGDVEIR